MKTIKIESIGHEPIVLNVPEGAKVSIEDGLTIVEPEFKKGDILYQNGIIVIFSGIYGERTQNGLNKQRILRLNFELGFHKEDNIRNATEAEKQILFDALAKAGKAWDAKKKEIVDLKYIPKVGDCVELSSDKGKVIIMVYGGLSKYGNHKNKGHYISSKLEIGTNTSLGFGEEYRNLKKLTHEELQAEFNKLGYEYDFETHTAKKLRWKPEIGESYFTTNGFNDIICHKWINDNTDNIYYNLCKCFKTEADAQKYKEYILKYHEQNN